MLTTLEQSPGNACVHTKGREEIYQHVNRGHLCIMVGLQMIWGFFFIIYLYFRKLICKKKRIFVILMNNPEKKD